MPDPHQEKPRRTLSGTIHDSLLERYPEAKPWKEWFREKFSGKKPKAWVVLAILGLLLGVAGFYIGYRTEHSKSQVELVKQKATNSYYAGQLSERDRENERLRNEIRDNKRTSEAEILSLKTDLNETRRQKDSEVAKLTLEREGALQRVAQWESLPANVLGLYTNLSMNAPTNIQEWGSLMQNFTNSLNDVISSRPYFDILLNNSKITDRQLILLDNSRSVFIEVINLGGMTARNVSLDVLSSIDKTNLFAEGWQASQFPPATYDGSISQQLPGWNVWSWTADRSVAAGNSYYAAGLTISTNYLGSLVPMVISVYSDNSKKQRFSLLLQVKPIN